MPGSKNRLCQELMASDDSKLKFPACLPFQNPGVSRILLTSTLPVLSHGTTKPGF